MGTGSVPVRPGVQMYVGVVAEDVAGGKTLPAKVAPVRLLRFRQMNRVRMQFKRCLTQNICDLG